VARLFSSDPCRRSNTEPQWRCELGAAIDGPVVRMACNGGASMARRVDEPELCRPKLSWTPVAAASARSPPCWSATVARAGHRRRLGRGSRRRPGNAAKKGTHFCAARLEVARFWDVTRDRVCHSSAS
jgi:hypothetical protein